MPAKAPKRPARIFISYARADVEHLTALEKHLAVLKRQNLIEVWTDQELEPGEPWKPVLQEALRTADVVLQLVSPDFMASDFIHDVELKEAFARHARGEVRIVPVLVRPTDLKGDRLDTLQGLPKGQRPISTWPDRDLAWREVVEGLRSVIAAVRPYRAILELSEESDGGAALTRQTLTDTRPPAYASARPTTAALNVVPPSGSRPNAAALTLLHISDLHFGQARGDGRIHFDQKKVVIELVADARRMCETMGTPDAILVTGDVAFSAQPQQYQQADEWLRELVLAVGINPEKVWIVPGNHDVDRNQATKPLGRKKIHHSLRSNPSELDDYFLKEHIAEFAEDLWPKFHCYADFARAWAAPTVNAEMPFWRQEISSPLGKVVLVGLNSCLLCLDNADAKANLALSQAQLQCLLERIPEDALVLALIHHPPGWLSDGEELLKELQKLPHMLFSGHVHALGGGVVHGAGKNALAGFEAGAAHAAPGEPGIHTFSWIRVSGEGVDWYPRHFSPRWNAFRADGEHLEEAQIHQRFEFALLPKRLQKWLLLGQPKSSQILNNSSKSGANSPGSSAGTLPATGVESSSQIDPFSLTTWEKAMAYFIVDPTV